MFASEPLHLTLEARKQLSPRSLELTYRCEEPVRYIPGQFFSLTFPWQGETHSRSYSIVNLDEDIASNHQLSFVITLVEEGRASGYFASAELGSEITATGPFGNLILPKLPPQRLILIATGAGVAPYRSMIAQLTAFLRQGVDLSLYFGAASRDEFLYGEEFLALAETYENFSVNACYSQSLPDNQENHELEGRVTAQFECLKTHPDNDLIYVCGNPDMIDDAVEFFSNQGFSARNLKREKYLFSKL